MRKYIYALLLLLALTGCVAKPQVVGSVEGPDWRVENHAWQMVSTDPEDYGITYDEFPELDGWPLDKLVAYCLGSDGIYAEEGFDQLYHYFLEAPHTCVSYFALIQDEVQREALCSHIAAVDAEWYEGTEEFQEILSKLAEAYPGGVDGSIVQLLKNGG